MKGVALLFVACGGPEWPGPVSLPSRPDVSPDSGATGPVGDRDVGGAVYLLPDPL